MNTLAKSKKLKPSDIVGIKMDSNRILHIWFNHLIENSEVDYEVAVYINDKKKKFEKAKGKCLGLYVDITNYKRLDCHALFDITVPSYKVRQMHSDMHKDAILKRVAFYKEDTSRVSEACVKMAAMYYGKDVKLFGDSNRATKWLEEGVRKFHS